MKVDSLRVGLFQGPLTSKDAIASVECNVEAIGAAARTAAASGASILVTPEMSATGYNIGGLVGTRAEPADGPIFDAIAAVAVSTGITIVYGYPELSGSDVYNSVQVVGRNGLSLANYRKTHLFGALDRENFVPGDTLVIGFDLDGIRCGLLICYDVEFPEAVRAHADAGTQWLIVPTGLMAPYEHIAQQVVPARAYESQMFVTYVNRCGSESELTYCGLSCAIDPTGRELARAGAAQELILTDISAAVVTRSRSLNTHLDDRRLDLYPDYRSQREGRR
ncbi:carbon-nitrogen hydrolase family protein [Rhodococcus globerulus]|uniref:Nitrilase n=1 Tax=Nocardia globerula TaxID=1818 RepID=A0A652YVR7_NOCGL|nr:carbon-nitrogen hydrolase family protein [Rhodococcus globerulus]MCE4264326.1 carbon-nitrogen hydrolase family protein [Rhodococcus globerulus]NMD60461.1 carbon-nitrogen hydrolase family protein [Nocardia globerula]PVX67996.1 nitrilase [Rhodococcus globerulus]